MAFCKAFQTAVPLRRDLHGFARACMEKSCHTLGAHQDHPQGCGTLVWEERSNPCAPILCRARGANALRRCLAPCSMALPDRGSFVVWAELWPEHALCLLLTEPCKCSRGSTVPLTWLIVALLAQGLYYRHHAYTASAHARRSFSIHSVSIPTISITCVVP